MGLFKKTREGIDVARQSIKDANAIAIVALLVAIMALFACMKRIP